MEVVSRGKSRDKPGRKNEAVMNKGVAEPIYPCPFPIKVIGENRKALEEIIVQVMSSFGEVIHPDEMAFKQSQNGNYLSITFKIVAKSREHIEQIYAEFNVRKEVKMVL